MKDDRSKRVKRDGEERMGNRGGGVGVRGNILVSQEFFCMVQGWRRGLAEGGKRRKRGWF